MPRTGRLPAGPVAARSIAIPIAVGPCRQPARAAQSPARPSRRAPASRPRAQRWQPPPWRCRARQTASSASCREMPDAGARRPPRRTRGTRRGKRATRCWPATPGHAETATMFGNGDTGSRPVDPNGRTWTKGRWDAADVARRKAASIPPNRASQDTSLTFQNASVARTAADSSTFCHGLTPFQASNRQ